MAGNSFERFFSHQETEVALLWAAIFPALAVFFLPEQFVPMFSYALLAFLQAAEAWVLKFRCGI
ncbi:MAG: hypothetical protein OIF57_14005 [Marinobacterium sp.]|nr:hypothetical protein [Marinobacterium sp.]